VPEEKGNLDYKWICTKETPWDGKTIPVLHKEGDFGDWPLENWIICPVCNGQFYLGPDV